MSFAKPTLILMLCLAPNGKPVSACMPPPSSPQAKAPVKSSEAVTTLRFTDLFVPEGDHLRLSDTVKALNGKRVSVTGFIAEQEDPLKGAFYLCPTPVATDESGAGIGDIPVNAIRVTMPGLEGKVMAPRRGAVIVVGKLDVGPHEEKEGTVTFVRLLADRPRIVKPEAGKPRKEAKTAAHTKKTKQ